jgi:ATP-dependent exoDNAse (exonuclease V) beta subunit
VWWDPLLLEGQSDDARGLRREDLIAKPASTADVAVDRAKYDQWRDSRAAVQRMGSAASMTVTTATQLKAAEGEPPIAFAHDVALENAGLSVIRPSGKRFGTLVHAVLAAMQLSASPSDVTSLAALYARLFSATDEERDSAAGLATALLTHPRLQAARQAEAEGRSVWREAPVTLRIDAGEAAPQLVDGQIDLAYETAEGWVVVDFKTDIEIASARDAYTQQVAMYVEAVQRSTGKPVTGVLLKV